MTYIIYKDMKYICILGASAFGFVYFLGGLMWAVYPTGFIMIVLFKLCFSFSYFNYSSAF